MSKRHPIYIHGCGMHSALGSSLEAIHAGLLAGISAGMQPSAAWLNDGGETVIGQVAGELPQISKQLPHKNTRNNRLALSALEQIAVPIADAIERYGSDRVAVVVGTSTFGMADGETAMTECLKTGAFPADYHYHQQEPANLSQFIADHYGVSGPTYTISTACSSSGRVYLSAARLLRAGLVDAVIVGGADTLCKLTLNGFHGLEALSSTRCNPFSVNRNGINIGEAAAFMLLSNTPENRTDNAPAIALLGAGDSSDAHHISAPHPEGRGAVQSMRRALADAGLEPDQIGYINAHGTATPLNDAMESKAIAAVFGDHVPVSSTKPLTGHTLGAASAVEAALCWHILRYQLPLPYQVNDGEVGDLPIQLAIPGMVLTAPAILSNSFAFGGNNVSLIFGYPDE